MDTDRWERVKELFQQALERPPDEQAAFLEQACPDDAALRREVAGLLVSEREASGFLDAPGFFDDVLPSGLGDAGAPEPGAFRLGQRLGPYQLERVVGHGGMGAVYLAERVDGQFQQQVAIKLLRRDLARPELLDRFRAERQILARLHHPNIARLLDGGTTEDGLPYIVMEYVEGVPLATYCDEHRLSTAERLALFQRVCGAVQYAHQNLVVHRDLKPSNILVTEEGDVKLLDFGVAKLLEEREAASLLTMTGLRAMTPEYASPEQVRGDPVTTASDIYSLGVVLYELLTGHRPYKVTRRVPSEVEQVICEQEPVRPSTAVTRAEAPDDAAGVTRPITPEAIGHARSTQPDRLRRQLSGDLDTIVMMALRKEPARRYASADQLSADLHRHLTGLPVLARKDTIGYRVGKFVRRHRVGVVATAAATLLVVALTTVYTIELAHERDRAERRFQDVRELANTFLFDFHDAIANLPGATPARALIVKRALEYLDRLSKEGDASDDPGLMRELATAYERVGNIQGNPYMSNLGDTKGALESHRRALAIREGLAARSDDPELDRELAASHDRIGEILEWSGDRQGALDQYQAALASRKDRLAADADSRTSRRDVAVSYFKIGGVQRTMGNRQDALHNYEQALAEIKALAETDSTDTWAQRAMSVCHNALGILYLNEGEAERSLVHFQAGLDLSRALTRANPTDPGARRDLTISYSRVGDALMAADRLDEAHRYITQALDLTQELADEDPENAQLQRDLAVCHYQLGMCLVQMEHFADAREHYDAALAIDEKRAATDTTNTGVQRDVALTHMRIGDVLAEQGERGAAARQYEQARTGVEALATADADDLVLQRDLAQIYSRLGKTAAAGPEADSAATAEALAWYRKSRERWQRVRDAGMLQADDDDAIDDVNEAIEQLGGDASASDGG